MYVGSCFLCAVIGCLCYFCCCYSFVSLIFCFGFFWWKIPENMPISMKAQCDTRLESRIIAVKSLHYFLKKTLDMVLENHEGENNCGKEKWLKDD